MEEEQQPNIFGGNSIRQCRQCSKGIDDKRRGAKFCSDQCRILYHQRDPRRGQRFREERSRRARNSSLRQIPKVPLGSRDRQRRDDSPAE